MITAFVGCPQCTIQPRDAGRQNRTADDSDVDDDPGEAVLEPRCLAGYDVSQPFKQTRQELITKAPRISPNKNKKRWHCATVASRQPSISIKTARLTETSIYAFENRTSEKSLTGRRGRTEQLALELGMCIEAVDRIWRLWDISSDEDRQGLVRSLFDSITYNLDTRRIVHYRLKPWADRFLVLRAALYDAETSDDGKTNTPQLDGQGVCTEVPHRGIRGTNRWNSGAGGSGGYPRTSAYSSAAASAA